MVGRLAGDLEAPGLAAGGTVVKPVFTQADVQLSLAKAAVLLAVAPFFDLFALVAADFGFGCHGRNCNAGVSSGERSVGNQKPGSGLQALALGLGPDLLIVPACEADPFRQVVRFDRRSPRIASLQAQSPEA